MVPAGLAILGEAEHGLPELPDTEIVLYRAPGALSRAAELLSEHIVHSLETAGNLHVTKIGEPSV
jgi:hypothetical protein